MDLTDVDVCALQLFQEHGPEATTIAAQRVWSAMSENDHLQVSMGRRIKAVSEICGALAS